MHVISRQEYDAAVQRLNTLIDAVGTNEQHPLYGLLDTLGTLIHTYEEQHHAIPDATGPQILQFLMDEHGLTPADIPELGSRDAVEGYLAEKQELRANQLRAIAQRFHVSPAAFL